MLLLGATLALDEPAPRIGRSRSAVLAASTVILLVSTLLALLLAEMVVRFVAPQQLIVAPSGIYRPDPVFGWRHKERLNVVVNTGEGPIQFRTDANGYRISGSRLESAFDRQEAPRRVITIGDSFLEAAAVKAEASLPALMESELSSHLGRTVVVDNDATAGWDPNQYLLAAKRATERDQYDAAVVFLYMGNDITSSKVERYAPEHVARRHDFRIPLEFSPKEWIDALAYPVNDRLETNSHLFVFAKQRLQMPLAKVGLTVMYFPPIFRRSELSSDSWRVTVEICEAINAEFARHGTRTIFVLIPTPYQVDEASFQSYIQVFGLDVTSVDLEQPNSVLGKQFSKKSLHLIDPLPELRLKHLEGIQLYGLIDRHFNENGHRALTEIVLPFVEFLLPSQSAS